MKPILYERTYTGGTDTLLGTLADATSCTVTEQRNGEYELELEYLPTGVLANELETGAVILAVPFYGATAQPFRIYQVDKSLTGTIQVSAHHISYDLNKVYLKYFNDTTGITATLAAIKSNLIQQSGDTTDWTFTNDGITNTTSIFKHPEPTTVRAALGGVEGSLLDTFGGEFEWDGFNVILHKARGEDRGVHIRYAGNLLEFTRTEDFEGAYSHVMVYWFDEETGNKTTSLSYPVHDLVASDFTQSRTAVIDVTDQFETQPNRATLNPVAQDYAAKMTSKPTIGLEVKFVDLNSTTEGGAEAPVKLCDTIHVIDPVRDVSIAAKVVETRWNVLLDRYEDVTIGTKGKNIADTISGLSASGGSSYSGSGGGGGGSTETDYRNLSNLPQINGVELVGNKSLSTLGIASASDLATTTATANAAVKDVTVNGTSVVNANKVAQVTVPTKTSDITNDSGFITASDVPAAPVTSVNGQTGAVNLAIPDSTSDLTNDSGFITASGAPVQSVNGQTGNVNLDIPTVQQVLAAGTEIARVFANSSDQTGTPIYAPAGGGGGMTGNPVYYGACDTAQGTAEKTVVCADFALETGAIIYVLFANMNTAGAISLNVNSTGAVAVKRSGVTSGHGRLWTAGAVRGFVYDGTNWEMIDPGAASTSNAGIVRLSDSTTSASSTMAATPKAVKAAYDNGGVQSVTPDYSSGVKVATFATSGGNVDLYLPVWNGSVSS